MLISTMTGQRAVPVSGPRSGLLGGSQVAQPAGLEPLKGAEPDEPCSSQFHRETLIRSLLLSLAPSLAGLWHVGGIDMCLNCRAANVPAGNWQCFPYYARVRVRVRLCLQAGFQTPSPQRRRRDASLAGGSASPDGGGTPLSYSHYGAASLLSPPAPQRRRPLAALQRSRSSGQPLAAADNMVSVSAAMSVQFHRQLWYMQRRCAVCSGLALPTHRDGYKHSADRSVAWTLYGGFRVST